MRCTAWTLWLAPLAVVALTGTAAAESISFQHDVMAVLSKSGCNQGGCHGNQNGKGGLKLSLRGDDPAFDFEALTRDSFGRRIDTLRPEASLVLLKATASVPHEGGKRFALYSPEYEILRRWIAAEARFDAAGAAALQRIEVTPASQVLVEPAERVQLHVRAIFGDGSTRIVTRLATYEPSNTNASVAANGEVQRERMGETAILVRYLDQRTAVQLAFVPARPDFVWREVPENNFIDRHVFAKLRTLRMTPSDLCSDSVFLRRAYLDIIGMVPSADEARDFLNDARPDKRARLIDRLLERPEFADFWALKWADVLRNEEKVLDKKGVQAFQQWIRHSIAEGQPLNDFARDLIAARGSTYSQPAANYYRALRDPQTRAEATAQVFLGIRLQCARCHNHPFDRWTQNDYHSLAAFFARIDYRIVQNDRKDRLDKHEFDGEQIVYDRRDGEVLNPRNGEAMRPLFLGAATPDFGDRGDRLQALADWVARPDNPFFARTQVNRIWYNLLGRGLVEPNDDFRASNPPVNGPLLEALTRDFVEHRFDLRHAIRTIMTSRTYQLAALPNDTNRDDETNFSHTLIRPLQAEQLLDSLSQVLGKPVKFNGHPLGLRAAELPGVPAQRLRGQDPPTPAEKFLKTFGKPDRLLSCECERSDDSTLNQAFQLLTGDLINGLLAAEDNRIGRALAAKQTDQEIVEQMYLTALCRLPTAKERDGTKTLIAKAKERRAALEDIAWGLVNAKEFLLRR
jgi:hypothetical protein